MVQLKPGYPHVAVSLDLFPSAKAPSPKSLSSAHHTTRPGHRERRRPVSAAAATRSAAAPHGQVRGVPGGPDRPGVRGRVEVVVDVLSPSCGGRGRHSIHGNVMGTRGDLI